MRGPGREGPADGFDVFRSEEGRNDGGPEFVRQAASGDDANAFGDGFDGSAHAGERIVLVRRGLYIHGDEVEEPVRKEGFQHLRAAAVGVELDEEAEGADGFDKVCEVGLEGRFASGHHNALDAAAAGREAIEYGLFGDARVRGGRTGEKPRVVAEGAAEVAALREDDGCDASGVVGKAYGFHPANKHVSGPYRAWEEKSPLPHPLSRLGGIW